MSSQIRAFLARHPYVRDAIVWALPAIIAGAILRFLFLSYSPYAYWGSDSKSYFSFAHKLVYEHYISLDEKRRYLYPILLAPVTMLPGATLKWLAILQHALGLATLVPLAYICRRTMVLWKAWVIPVTIAYAGLPMTLWYEHELLGENVFFATLLWTFAGWTAWASQRDVARARAMFWWFFVPFAMFLITKPSGRFIWPGIALGILVAGLLRVVTRKQWIALGVLAVFTLTVGSKKQGAWLLYVATFPLTQLDSKLHADYKAQIRDMVGEQRSNLDTYYLHDGGPFGFLESPSLDKTADARPLWAALDSDVKKKSSVYMALALEAIKAEPLRFLYLGWQRVVASVNPSEFKDSRFNASYYPDRFDHHFDEAVNVLGRKKPTPIAKLFGYGWTGPLPTYAEFSQRISPAPGSFAERTVVGWVQGYQRVSDVVRLPQDPRSEDRGIGKTQLLPLGWWLLAGALLTVILRPYRATLGVWTLVAASYLSGVFLVSQTNPRYFCPAWVVIVVLLAVPLDAIARLLQRRSEQKSV